MITQEHSHYSFSQPNLAASSAQNQDFGILNELKQYLTQLIQLPQGEGSWLRGSVYNGFQSLFLNTCTPDGRGLRITVLDRETLVEAQTLYFVGFFGQKKVEIEPEVQSKIMRLDRTLLRSLERFPSILSYSSLELPDRYNYANLVLFHQPEEIERWKEKNRLHRVAAENASPGYYAQVRIHLGTLEGGLTSNFSPNITKNYQF